MNAFLHQVWGVVCVELLQFCSRVIFYLFYLTEGHHQRRGGRGPSILSIHLCIGLAGREVGEGRGREGSRCGDMVAELKLRGSRALFDAKDVALNRRVTLGQLQLSWDAKQWLQEHRFAWTDVRRTMAAFGRHLLPFWQG